MENMGQVDLRRSPGGRADIAGNGDPVAKSIQDQAKGQGRQPAGKGVKARPGFRFEERQKNMKGEMRIINIQEMPRIKICLLFKYHNFTLLITNIPIDFL